MGILEYWQGLFPFQKYFPSAFSYKYIFNLLCDHSKTCPWKWETYFFPWYNWKHLCEDSAEVYSVKHYVICNHSFWVQGLRFPFLYRTHIAVCRDVLFDVGQVQFFVVQLNFCLSSLPVALFCHTWTAGTLFLLPPSKPIDDQRWLLFHLFMLPQSPPISICFSTC